MDTTTAKVGCALLTFGDVVAQLRVSRRTLERLVSRGIFPAPMKIGSACRFAQADVSDYLKRARKRQIVGL